ncbi:MAG: hypothetical protein L6R36_009538 [Xanthoria steineri]|nr:MAG: hypothetical protein L6R36_009538 [Xanthoria steineri]
MPSSAETRQALSLETELNGLEMAPCTACRNAKPRKGEPRKRCIVGSRSGRCSECIRKGYVKCDVTVSRSEWERLRDGRDQLRLDLERAEEKEAELLQQLLSHKARTVRLRKQLRQAERRTDVAVAREVEDLEEADRVEEAFLGLEEPGVEAADRPFFHDILEMPPSDWANIDGLENFPWQFPESPPLPVSAGGPS